MPSRNLSQTTARDEVRTARPSLQQTRPRAGSWTANPPDAGSDDLGGSSAVGARRARRLAGATLALIVLAGAVARFWGIDFGLPFTQARPDETTVMDVALEYLRGNFWHPFYDYPRFYNYLLYVCYLGYYVVGALAGTFTSIAGFVASWSFHWSPFFLVNRGLAAAAGVLTIPVVYALGCRVGARSTGLVAALFMALAYGHVRDSHFGTTDTTLVLLCAASVLWLLRWEQDRSAPSGVAAVVAGLAAATKYNAVLLAVPLALSQVFHAWDHPSGRVAVLVGRRAWLLAVAFGVAFAIGIPFVFFDNQNFRQGLLDLYGSMGVGHGARPTVNGWWRHLSVSLRYGLGVPLLGCGLAGTVLTVWRSPRIGTLLFSFPIAYFAVAGSLSLLFARYVLPVVPFLCVAAAVLVTGIAGVLARSPLARGGVTAVLALAVVAPSARSVVQFDWVMAQTDSRVVAAEWLARHAVPGSSIMVSGSPYGYPERGSQFHSWFWDRQRRIFVFRGQPAEGQPDWILLQESPLRSATQPVVVDLLNSGYERLLTIRAFDPRERNLYDLQDAFFVPFAGFAKVRRPGPNFVIYKHPNARYVSGAIDGGDR